MDVANKKATSPKKKATTRKSLPLSERDLHDLTKLRASKKQLAALGDLTGSKLTDGASEAVVLRAVWEAGIKTVHERLEEQGYAEMAAQQDAAARQRVARRRRPSWADES